MARAAIEIAADQRVVWAILTNIDGWPTWNPAIREAALKDDLEVGRSFRYATAFGALRCKIRRVDAPHELAWSSRLLTMAHRQIWTIRPSSSGCTATTVASLSGVGAWLFKSRLVPRLRAELDAVVRLLKLEAEIRIADSMGSTGTEGEHE